MELERQEKTSRRTFLGYMIGAIVAFIGSTTGAAAAIFAATPIFKEQPGTSVDLGAVSSFSMGVPKLVDFPLQRKDGWVLEEARKSVWVVRTSESEFVTYSPRCTHLGCIVSWNSQQKLFKSPCHSGVFNLDGDVVGGPPPRPLDRLEHRIEDGRLVVAYREFRLGVPEKLEV